MHVPESIEKKNQLYKFVNFTVLLKDRVELAELFGSNLLSINEKGQLEARLKNVSDKIVSVEKWTDAFCIFFEYLLARITTKNARNLKVYFHHQRGGK